MALTRYTRVKTIGMCHQINKGYSLVGQVLGLTPREDDHFPEAEIAIPLKSRIDLKTSGLNHITWIQEMREQGTGRDLYPEFRERLQKMDPDFEPLSRRLYDAFGLFPATGDGHVGEYFSYAHEYSEMTGYDFDAREEESRDLDADVERASQPGAPLDRFLKQSGERGVHVAAAILNNLNQYEITVNVVNHGAVPGLPDWAVIEAPAVVSSSGVIPLRMPALPPAILAVLNQQVAIQDRVVEAAVHGDRQAALQALLLDPTTQNFSAAEQLLDEFLETHADYLPAFAGGERALA
jgi:alpha-galactosidase